MSSFSLFLTIIGLIFLSSQTNADVTKQVKDVWNGPITFVSRSTNPLSMCGVVRVTNTAAKAANSFVITASLCRGQLNSVFGNGVSSIKMSDDSTTENWRIFAEKVLIPKNGAFEVRICYSFDSTFNPSTDLLLGVDFSSDDTLGSDPKQYIAVCGSGTCLSKENKNNCPIDCLQTKCKIRNVNSRIAWRDDTDDNRGQNANPFPGTVRYELKKNANQKDVCVGLFIHHDDKTKVGKSYILTMRSCGNYAKVRGMFGGGSQDSLNEISDVHAFRQVGRSGIYKSGIEYSVGAACFSANSNFDISKHVRFGLEFKDQIINCDAKTCVAECGNEKCDSGETANNCPIDCDPLNCSK